VPLLLAIGQIHHHPYENGNAALFLSAGCPRHSRGQPQPMKPRGRRAQGVRFTGREQPERKQEIPPPAIPSTDGCRDVDTVKERHDHVFH